MRRSFTFRLLATWLACWLPLVLADSGWLHACPMHAPSTPVVHHAMAHGMSQNDLTSPRTHGHTPGHGCTCDGACCAPLAMVAAGAPAGITAARVARIATPAAARSDAEYVAAWVDFVLPFATAPPMAHAIA